MVLKQETGGKLHCSLLGGFSPKSGIILTSQLIYSSDDQIRLMIQQNVWNVRNYIATKVLEHQTGKTSIQSLSGSKFNCIKDFCSTL